MFIYIHTAAITYSSNPFCDNGGRAPCAEIDGIIHVDGDDFYRLVNLLPLPRDSEDETERE